MYRVNVTWSKGSTPDEIREEYEERQREVMQYLRGATPETALSLSSNEATPEMESSTSANKDALHIRDIQTTSKKRRHSGTTLSINDTGQTHRRSVWPQPPAKRRRPH